MREAHVEVVETPWLKAEEVCGIGNRRVGCTGSELLSRIKKTGGQEEKPTLKKKNYNCTAIVNESLKGKFKFIKNCSVVVTNRQCCKIGLLSSSFA